MVMCMVKMLCELSLIIFFHYTKPVIQRNRFFTLCHYPVSRLSPTAFLPPFRMTIGGKGVIMRETLIVILSGCEGSMPLIRNPQAQLENLYLKTAFYSPNSRRISSLFNVCSLSDKLISIKSGLRRRVYSGQSVSICLFA